MSQTSSFPTVPLILGLAVVAIAGDGGGAIAADADFYKGKQITLLVSTDVATTYDLYARLMADFWARHIPGNPKIVVQNMPGAGGLKVTNHIFNGAPRDGLTVASAHGHIPTDPLLAPDGVQYDVTKINWLGNISSETFTGFVWHTSPIKTLEDTKTVPSVMGAGDVASASAVYAAIANDFFGTKFKIVPGYKGAPEVKLAMERGEVDGTFGTGWSSIKTGNPEWLRDKLIRVIAQFGMTRHPELPDVPLFIDWATTPDTRAALELQFAQQVATKPYFTPPEVPPERLAALRQGFDATMKDQDFWAAVKKGDLPTEGAMTAAELTAMIQRLSKTSPEAVKRLLSAAAKIR
jgi:tripartite-type tricarboxylate transporter receptor subunit TctC